MAARLRKLQLEKSDRIYAAHAPNVKNEKSAAIMLKVLAREAALLGIDAPYPIVFPPIAPEQDYDCERLTIDETRSLHGLLTKCAMNVIAADPTTTEDVAAGSKANCRP